MITITDANYEEMVQTDKLLVLDFGATWCMPCKTVAAILTELSETYAESAVIGKVDVDDNPDLVAKYGIRNVPTIFLVRNGEIVDKMVGGCPKTEIVAKIEANINK
ncbi:MAG: thioredoxin domain-containing protein [Paludibacteraceae bacterium]|nr:thioredoxin domain-containing protein [Paludibacteraceae bacterium]